MLLNRELIGYAGCIPIKHGSATFEFEDYDVIFQILRNEKPKSYHHYGEPNMIGLEVYWGDEYRVERISFKDFYRQIIDNWSTIKNSLKCNVDLLDKTEVLYHWDGDIKLDEYETLSLKYSEVCFQVTDCGICPFDRITETVKMFDYNGAAKKIASM